MEHPDSEVRRIRTRSSNAFGPRNDQLTHASSSVDPGLVAAGIEPNRQNMTHALRHWYASTLLDAGESIKTVASHLGHADASFTLKTYTHLMPSSEARTRKAVDNALADDATASHVDSLLTSATPGVAV